MTSTKKLILEGSYNHCYYGSHLDRMAQDALDTVIYDEEAVVGEILDALSAKSGELSPSQVYVCDKAEAFLSSARRKRLALMDRAAKMKRRAAEHRRSSVSYAAVAKKQKSPWTPYIFALAWLAVGAIKFFSLDPDAMGDAIIMGLMFIIIAPICMVVSALRADGNKHSRHAHGIHDRNMDLQDSITTAAGIGGAAHSAWTIGQAPGKMMKHMTKDKNH